MPQDFLFPQRDQPLLMPADMREWLPGDDRAFVMLDAVATLDLGEFGCRYRADGHGRAAFDPEMMVALLLCGYCQGERSSRVLGKAVRAGRGLPGDGRRAAPDHAAIARFRARREKALGTPKGRSDAGTTLRLRTRPVPWRPEGWTDTGRGSSQPMILPKVRDPRFVTIRRGGTLTDSDHHLLALWAASCAEHVLHLFESAQPDDPRPREAIGHARAWVRGEVTMMKARAAGGHAMGAARNLRGAARHAAYAAGQAGAVAHVAAHELGAAAYAIKAARASAPEGESEAAGRLECQWQRDQLPEAIRELVLDDQRLRNDICWSAFDC